MVRFGLPIFLVVMLFAVAEFTDRPPVESPNPAVCLEDDGFAAAGELPVRPQPEPPATGFRIAALHWEEHGGCERVAIVLGDAEDGVPFWRAELLRDLGILRIHLPGADAVAPTATDAAFDGELVRAAYVVRPFAGGHFVDLHLAAPAEARVRFDDETGSILVDLRPGGGPLQPPAARQGLVVVITPRPGEAGYPLQVTGYGRTFEANVVARLEQGGEDVFLTFTTANGWLDAWGEFSMSIPDGPSGPVTLHVGEYSAADGTWSGVAVELNMLP